MMIEFVGLRAKMYAYRTLDGKEDKRCKGIKKSVVKNEINFDNYKECLLTGKDQYRNMNVLRSYKHEYYTEEVNKKVLGSDDDKRYILENSIDTLAIGHYKIRTGL